MRKIPGKAAVMFGLVAFSLAISPKKADAFTINYFPITGAGPTGELQADILIRQGADANLGENQAEWTVKLLDSDGTISDDSLGFKSFGFNFTDELAGKVSFESLTRGWRDVSGNGTGSQRLTGNAGMKFDYVYSASARRFKSSTISFITTFDADGDRSTIEEITYDNFTEALLSTSRTGLSGQVAANIVGFKSVYAPKGTTIAGEVPTPALLPGLIGMGVAAIRKRRHSESELEGELSD